MSFLRHRQRPVTAKTPHNANRRYLIPKRQKTPPAPPENLLVDAQGNVLVDEQGNYLTYVA